jgi:hypothetical protein
MPADKDVELVMPVHVATHPGAFDTANQQNTIFQIANKFILDHIN